MTTTLRSVSFLSGGYCRQFARLTGVPSWAFARFHAVFVYVDHPEHGASLIDTGYSRHFWQATWPFPQRFHRWLLPVRLHPDDDPPQILESAGCDKDIRRIFISHWHSDHVAGLKCFPRSEFVYRSPAYKRLMAEGTVNQVRHGFLRDLLPADLEERSRVVAEDRFVAGSGELEEFEVCDYWGDGSLLLVDLPGHMEGQTGFLLNTERRRFFYVADAYWHQDVLLEGRGLPWLSRGIQHDYTAYLATQDKLRRLALRTNWKLIACHCRKALPYVQGTSY